MESLSEDLSLDHNDLIQNVCTNLRLEIGAQSGVPKNQGSEMSAAGQLESEIYF